MFVLVGLKLKWFTRIV